MAHLQGRMPHGVLDEWLKACQSAKSDEDEDKCVKKALYIASTIVDLIHSFRATVPKHVEKQTISSVPHVLQSISEVSQHFSYCATRATLEELVAYSGTAGYDVLPSWMTSVVMHNYIASMEDWMRNGMKLSKFLSMCCHAGGGMALLIQDNIRFYLTFNQMLHHGWELPHELEEGPPTTIKDCILNEAKLSFKEMCSAYDNRDYRRFGPIRQLWQKFQAKQLTNEDLHNHIKAHVFPEICHMAHLLVYDENLHGTLPSTDLTQDKSPTLPQSRCTHLICESILNVLAGYLRQQRGFAKVKGILCKLSTLSYEKYNRYR